MITIQTKLSNNATKFVRRYNLLFNKILRMLFVDLYIKKKDVNLLKRTYQIRFGINARQYNSIKNQLDAKIAARDKQYSQEIEQLDGRIKKLEKLSKITYRK